MAVLISGVEPHSPAFKAGLKEGDTLLSLNSHGVDDVLDYRFYMTEQALRVEYLAGGVLKSALVHKGEYEDLGLLFDTYLMDSQRHCKNKCVFCFIDQLPKGLRDSLYFKDDDSRLSFLFGNYITLTNVTEREVNRIMEMHISPVNISVHTMNPELRVRMMNNPHAGEALAILPRLAKAGIKMNCQLVLCPGYNDGEELSFTLRELGKLYPAVQSVAAVPVGLTKYREGLAEITPFDSGMAADVIDRMERFGDAFLKEHGTRLCYPADEFYLKAKRRLPASDFYEDFYQLENGVGSYTLLKEEFLEALEEQEESDDPRSVSLATGVAAEELMQFLVDEARKKWHNLKTSVFPVPNEFFGPLITVAGLVTGRDLISRLKGERLADELLIPEVMLRREGDLFLDDVSVEEVSRALKVRVRPVPNDGRLLLQTLLGVL